MLENQEELQEQTTETAGVQTEETVNQDNADIQEPSQENPNPENNQVQPVSEKIKSLNTILGYVAVNKPIIFDKCVKTGAVAMSIFDLLKMDFDLIKSGNNEEARLEKEDLVVASYMANSGLIGIPEYILYKGDLTGGEYDMMKQHTKLSANSALPISPVSTLAILDHHELPLAKGYNKKMTGVSRSAYVIGIADRFIDDAHMTSSLNKPAKSRYDAVSNAVSMFDNTSQVFSVEEINTIAALLLNINI